MVSGSVTWEGLGRVQDRLQERLGFVPGLHRLLFQPMHFRPLVEVSVFLKTEEDKEHCLASGTSAEVERVVCEALSEAGLGPEQGRHAVFFFDSHENVVRNYEGNYFLRLR